MSDPLQLTLILHLHRPPGLDPRARLAAWDDCFEPIIGVLSDNPDVRVGLVLAGELVDDLKESHPDGIERIAKLVSRDQVELVGTPLHEPVLASVPERDGTDQILTHATLIKKAFGIRPTGCWLPLGIWDPSLPRVIAKASMQWCPVEDRFLVDVGAGREGVHGAWRTEREGYAIGLLPVDTTIRDMATKVPAEQVFAHLRKRAERGHQHITLAFSAARLGLRSGRDANADQHYLVNFLAGLARVTDEVQTIRPSDAASGFPQMGQVYLPSSAPSHIGVPWERNLARYDEANRVHKKMLKVSREVHRLDREVKEGAHSALRPDPNLLVQARRYLYRGQNPGAYWHGDESGIYDPALRARTWRDLLRAEQVAAKALQRGRRMVVETVDLDCDGIKEVVFRTPNLSVVVDPARGAAVTELSWYGAYRNLVNTMTRVPEPYHAALAEGELPDMLDTSDTTVDEWEEDEAPTALTRIPIELLEQAEAGLERAIGRDERPRVSFIERMIGPEVTLEDIQRGTLHEVGRGVQDAVWELVTTERRGDDVLRAMFSTDVMLNGDDKARVRLHKRYTLRRDPTVEVRVEVANRTHQALRTRLTMELNLTLGPDPTQQSLMIDGRRIELSEVGEIPEVDRLHLECAAHKATIEVHRPAKLWHYPIQTFHRHRGHKVGAIQGVCLVLQWAVELWGRERDAVALNLELLESR